MPSATRRVNVAGWQAGWRTLVPLAVGGAIALIAAGALTAGATDALPSRSAQQLLADLSAADVQGYVGTVVQKSTLINESDRTSSELSLATLMAGTNTIRVWSGGATRQRIAVLNGTGESDMYRDGDRVWQWDSSTYQALFQSVSTPDARGTVSAVPVPVNATTVTPDELARSAIAAIGPTTTLEVTSPSTVAGRPVYRVVITPPKTSSTRIGSVVLSLDGDTKMALAAQVYAKGSPTVAAIDLSFTRIAFEMPDNQAFEFNPPPGATITTYNSVSTEAVTPDPLLGLLSTTTSGTGWTRVAVISPPNHSPATQQALVAQFEGLLTNDSGTWGSGKVLQTPLLSMLFLDDGRIVTGAVDPSALAAAL